MQRSTLTWGLAGPITVDAETRANQRPLPRPAAPFCRPRPCCAALRPPRRNRFQLAHPVTLFPRVMAVSRPAANIARAGRGNIGEVAICAQLPRRRSSTKRRFPTFRNPRPKPDVILVAAGCS